MSGDGDLLDNWDPVDMLSDNLATLASMESHLCVVKRLENVVTRLSGGNSLAAEAIPHPGL